MKLVFSFFGSTTDLVAPISNINDAAQFKSMVDDTVKEAVLLSSTGKVLKRFK